MNWLEHIIDPEKGYIEESKTDLKNVWLKAQDDIPSSAFVLSRNSVFVQMKSLIEPGAVLHAVQQFHHSHDWCKETIAAMPNMQLVVHFRLCITDHDKKHGLKTPPLENGEPPGDGAPSHL